MKRAVPCAPRFRSRVFTTPQRLSQLRVSRPCFVPQPFLGSSLQSLPLAKIAHPSRGGLLPCSYPPARGSAPPDSLSPSVSSNSHAFARSPASPDDYGLPFKTDRNQPTRSSWAPSDGITPSHQLHLLRSVLFPLRIRSPRRPGCPDPPGRCSLGFLPL